MRNFNYNMLNSCYKLNNIYWNLTNEPVYINYLNKASNGTLHVKKGGTVETWQSWMNTLGSGWTLVDDIE